MGLRGLVNWEGIPASAMSCKLPQFSCYLFSGRFSWSTGDVSFFCRYLWRSDDNHVKSSFRCDFKMSLNIEHSSRCRWNVPDDWLTDNEGITTNILSRVHARGRIGKWIDCIGQHPLHRFFPHSLFVWNGFFPNGMKEWSNYPGTKNVNYLIRQWVFTNN